MARLIEKHVACRLTINLTCLTADISRFLVEQQERGLLSGCGQFTGNPESAGINRHVGVRKVAKERKQERFTALLLQRASRPGGG
jgi:hypothetical protein